MIETTKSGRPARRLSRCRSCFCTRPFSSCLPSSLPRDLQIPPVRRKAEAEPKPTLREYLTRDARPVRQPGTSFSYSNVGFNLLELLIEEVSDRDFAEYMKDEVLLPLRMETTDFRHHRG